MRAFADNPTLSSLRLTNGVFTTQLRTLSLKMNWSHPSALSVNSRNMPIVFCKNPNKIFKMIALKTSPTSKKSLKPFFKNNSKPAHASQHHVTT
jgi:hypothetical protein